MTPELPASIPEVVAIVSAQTGAGKTTTAVNLALALAAAGRAVLLIDLDPRGSAGDSLVQGHDCAGGIAQVLLDGTLSHARMTATEVPGLYLIPAGTELARVERELSLMGDSRTRLHQALDTLPALLTHVDHILIDTPPDSGLLTINALTGAHRVLIPLHCQPSAHEQLPVLLKTITRLRAGLPHPFQGAWLLPRASVDPVATRATEEILRQDYAPMLLATGIPHDGAIQDAALADRPLLVATPRCPAAQAYVSLAAEWLARFEAGQRLSEGRRYKHWRERSVNLRAVIDQRIEAWLIDPSSLLYDEREARLHQDGSVLEELFRVTQPERPLRPWWRPHAGFSIAFAMTLLVALFTLPPWHAWEHWRLDLVGWLLGRDQQWDTGSQLLMRADAPAYREIQFAVDVFGDNREQILVCREQAQARQDTQVCHIRVAPPDPAP